MNELRARIKEAGFKTQRAFGAYVGMTEEHLSRMAKGRKEVPLIMARLLDALIENRRLKSEGK